MFELEGRYTITRRNAALQVLGEPITFNNLITTIGLDRIGVGSTMDYARVGTSSAEPQFTDKALGAQIAASSSGALSRVNDPDRKWVEITHTYRFQQGTAAGNLSEVGVGWSTTGDTLFSRALIKDSAGNPTTITVLPNEVLDVAYTIRVYHDSSDVVNTVTIFGNDYTITSRPSEAPGLGDWVVKGIAGGWVNADMYSGDIGPTTGKPSGTNGGTSDDRGFLPYVTGSFSRSYTAHHPLNIGNGTWRSIVTTGPIIPKFQMRFDPPFVKDNTMTCTWTFTFSWGRR